MSCNIIINPADNLLETIGLVKKFFSRLEVDVYLKCIL